MIVGMQRIVGGTSVKGKHMPVVLMILDGWGISEQTDGNAIAKSNTKNMDRLWANYGHSQLQCSGEAVGLPDGQQGNSEVGHLNLGAGRVVYQELTRINQAVRNHTLQDNACLLYTSPSPRDRG